MEHSHGSGESEICIINISGTGLDCPGSSGFDDFSPWWARAPAPKFSCDGFDPPLVTAVTVHKNRALPLKAELFDEDNFLVSDSDLISPPVVQVIFSSIIGGDPIDVTDDALPAGKGTDGNVFVFDFASGRWRFNLLTKNYSAPGTYAISRVSGDEFEYVIDPTCGVDFIIE